MHYHWENSNALIKDIEVFAPHKRQEALIHAPENADPKQLWNLSCAIRKAGFAAEADNDGDKPVLRVTNFELQEELFATLKKEGAISADQPTTTKTDRDVSKKKGMNKLQIAGAMQMIADMMIIGGTWHNRGWEKGKGDILGSAKFAGAFSLLTLFGAKSPDKQTDYIYKDLKDKLIKSGYQIGSEDAASLVKLAEKDGILPKIERAVREHPVMINALIQASGGLNNIFAGYDQKFFDGKTNYLKSLGGVTTTTGQLLGGVLLDPKAKETLNISPSGNEFHTDKSTTNNNTPLANDSAELSSSESKDPTIEIVKKEDEKNKGFFTKIKDKIDEKPLFLTGNLSFLSNASRIAGGFLEKVKFKKYMGADNLKEAAENNFEGGIYAKYRKDYFDDIDKHQIERHTNEILKDSIKINENIALKPKNTPKGDIEYKYKDIAQGEKDRKHIKEAIEKREKLNETFTTVSKTNAAGTIDLVANIIKMASNILIAGSSSKIDADLDKTGQLDEICNFMAHVTKAQPPAMRNETLQGLSIMLASQNGIDVDENEVSTRISKKLAQLDNNPWSRPETHEKEAAPKPATPPPPTPQLHEIASHTMQQQSPFEMQPSNV